MKHIDMFGLETRRAIEVVCRGVDQGAVWNSDFRAAKSWLESELQRDNGLRDLLLASGDGSGSRTEHEAYPGISGLYYDLPSNMHEVSIARKRWPSWRISRAVSRWA